MIRNPAQIMQMRLGLPATPANFGGDSKSDSSTSTTNNTTNHTDYNDLRNVAQDSAVSLSGSNNVVDRSTSNLTQFFDSSNRSSTSLTSFMDMSDRSTNFSDSRTTTTVDNSDRSVHMTSTDHGAVLAGQALGMKALDMSGQTVSDAFGFMKQQNQTSLDATRAAFDLAKSSGANSLAGSAAVLGFAADTIGEARAAFQEAEDGGQKTIAMYAIAAVAAIGVAVALRR